MTDDITLDDLPQPAEQTTVHPDDLEVDGDNPNEQPDEMFGLLCQNMRKKGWIGNHIIADTDGVIADGEHRWLAAQEIGLTEVPVAYYNIDDAERRLWRQELNKISGEHDSKRDALEYDYLLDNGQSEAVTDLVEAAGEDLDDILAEIRIDTSTPASYEYSPDHNVYFEDCVEGMRDRVDDDSVDMVFTSPPYNIGSFANQDRSSESTAYDDEKDEDEYRDFLNTVFREIARVTTDAGHVFINVGIRNTKHPTLFPSWVIDMMPMPLQSVICWHKDYLGIGASQANMNHEGRFYQMWEPIFHFSTDPTALNDTDHYGVWTVRAEIEVTDHPAAFPTELVEKAIDATATPGDTVLDPFMGSGTTAVAAIQNDLDYIGFELDEDGAYQPIVERRIAEAERAKDATVNDPPEPEP